jgi:hypothetical protein
MKQSNDNRMTNCHKGGIKIKDTGANAPNPFLNINPFTENKVVPTFSSYENIDLDINNYSKDELFTLFGIKHNSLTENIMKDCKKIVLKTHPDKSRLDEKYFLFFSSAYKKLLSIYEFQNKSDAKHNKNTEYFENEHVTILDNIFEAKKDLKEPKHFNKWFNDQFNKHKLDDPNEDGYGGWLKSDEDIVYMPSISNTAAMTSEIEKRKKYVQSITTYKGVSDNTSFGFGGSSLTSFNDNNYSSANGTGMDYTDLRQAYVESVIPVTEEDYNKTIKFNSVDDYKRHRDSINTTPLSKEESMRRLYQENKQTDNDAIALAFYYAEQSEKAKQNQDNFWSGLKQVTNW